MDRLRKAIVVGVVVAVACVGILSWIASREGAFRRLELERETQLVARQVTRQLWAGLEHQRIGLQQVANFFRNSKEVTEEEFYDFASATLRMNRACLRLSYIDPSFRVRWVHPLEENRDLLQTDVRAHPEVYATLVRAAQSHEPVLSPPLSLLNGARGFILAVPIYRQQAFLGLVTESFRISDFFAAMVMSEVLERYHLNVLESGLTPLFDSDPSAPVHAEKSVPAEEFALGGSHWVVELHPRESLENQRLAAGQGSFWLVGLALALALGGTVSLAIYLGSTASSSSTGAPAGSLDALSGRLGASASVGQAEKMTALSQIISGVAHEMNNPLCSILGYSQILKATDISPHVRSRLDIIHTEAERMSQLLRGLLTFAGKHPPERKRLGLNGIVSKTLELKAYHFKVSQIEVEKALAPDLPMTQLDFHQIQQVVLQLLSNAEQTMVDTGERGTIRISTHSLGDRIELRVADDGPGIDPAIQGRLFEPFFTTRESRHHVGMGLALCYGIVHEHGGSIRVESRPGQGATFVVELPVVSDETGAGGGAAPEPTHTGQQLRVLVIDPEASLQDLLVDLLSAKGHLVDTASDVPEALRKIAAGSYDLIVTDVRMPKGTGKDIYQAVVGKSPILAGRIVYTSSEGTGGRALEFVRDVGGEIISKPFRIEEVERAIASALRR
jgi:signal transduction histidine kinase